nr:hypothetical protein [Desulfobulbaceae bacterium]
MTDEIIEKLILKRACKNKKTLYFDMKFTFCFLAVPFFLFQFKGAEMIIDLTSKDQAILNKNQLHIIDDVPLLTFEMSEWRVTNLNKKVSFERKLLTGNVVFIILCLTEKKV